MKRRWVSIALWIVALVVMLGAARWQRTTGPTYPVSAEIEIDTMTGTIEWPRSGTTDAPVTIEWPGRVIVRDAWVMWRRYPSDDAFQRIDMDHRTARAELPVQPAAGKLEYTVHAEALDGTVHRFPREGEPIVLRYKDPVPLGVLIPHVALMFLSMMFGVRAALGAARGSRETRWLVPTTAIGLTLGGMILGPIVQKHAFGAYWTGWPNGGDLTDNKTLIMWSVWGVVAIAFLLGRRWRASFWGRLAVGLATLVMLTVYLVPHSLRGSELDYEALDAGMDAHEAIRTGERPD